MYWDGQVFYESDFTYASFEIVSAELLCDWMEFLFYALFLQLTGVQKYTCVQ